MGLLDENTRRLGGQRMSGRRRGCVQALAMLAAAGLVAACGGGNHSAAAPAAGAAGTLAAAPGGSGCGQPATAGSVMYSLQSGGHTREVIVHVPASYSGKAKVPLVLNLHGSESTAQAQEVFSGMDATSDADGFIVAYPQALIPAGSGYDWNIPGVPLLGGQYPPANAANDVTFPHRPGPRPRREILRRHPPGVRHGHVRRRADGQPARLRRVADLRRGRPGRGPAVPKPVPGRQAGAGDRVPRHRRRGRPLRRQRPALLDVFGAGSGARWAAKDGCQAATPRTVRSNGYILTEYGACVKRGRRRAVRDRQARDTNGRVVPRCPPRSLSRLARKATR